MERYRRTIQNALRAGKIVPVAHLNPHQILALLPALLRVLPTDAWIAVIEPESIGNAIPYGFERAPDIVIVKEARRDASEDYLARKRVLSREEESRRSFFLRAAAPRLPDFVRVANRNRFNRNR
jgi:hypothetical protein